MILAVLLALAAPVDDFHASLGTLAKEQAAQLLAKPLPIKAGGFEGTLKVVEPGKRLAVKVKDFALASDTVTAKTAVGVEVVLDGKLMLGEEPAEVKIRLRVKANAAVKATLARQGADFVVRPAVSDVDVTDVEVLSFSPEVVPGGNLVLAGIIKGLIRKEKDRLLKDVAVVTLPRPAVLPASLAGDSPVLRQYLQGLVATRLAQHDSPRTGLAIQEKDGAIDARGRAWFVSPARRLNVFVTRLQIVDGIVYVTGHLDAPVTAAVQFALPADVTGEATVHGRLRVAVEADVQLKDGGPGGCNVYLLAAELSDLSGEEARLPVVRRLIYRAVNVGLEHKADEERAKIEKLAGGPRRERLVAQAYRQALGREPDPVGLRGHAAALARSTPRELLEGLIASPEFEGRSVKGRTPAEVVAAVYRAALGRKPTAAEVKSGTALLASEETVYEERRVLRRAPLRFERERVAVGKQPRTYRSLAAELLKSDEYRQRFGVGLPR